MNIFLELAKQGYEFNIKPGKLQQVEISIIGNNNNGKLVWGSAVIVHELIADDKSVNSFVDAMIDKLKRTES